MHAVYRHELSSQFTGLTAYVFGAFVLLFAGVFTMVFNIDMAMAHFEYVFGNTYMPLVFVIAVPILTMRVISEERRQKTDQLLYSLPISMTQVVLGKYLALLTVLLIPMLIIATYPVLLSAYGAVYMPAAFGALTGFFLLGAALLAIGMFISSCTESQAVSAGVCFVVMLINYFVATLASYVGTDAFTSYVAFAVVALIVSAIIYLMTKNYFVTLVICALSQAGLLAWYLLDSSVFSGAFGALIRKLSLFEQFYSFVDGVFDLKSVVYLLSVCVLFVFLTIQSMEKRRWSE